MKRCAAQPKPGPNSRTLWRGFRNLRASNQFTPPPRAAAESPASPAHLPNLPVPFTSDLALSTPLFSKTLHIFHSSYLNGNPLQISKQFPNLRTSNQITRSCPAALESLRPRRIPIACSHNFRPSSPTQHLGFPRHYIFFIRPISSKSPFKTATQRTLHPQLPLPSNQVQQPEPSHQKPFYS